MKITSKKGLDFAPLAIGKHNVEIKNIQLVEYSKPDENGEPMFSDPTPRLAVNLANKAGQITQWFNLKGYKTFEDLSETNKESGKFISLGENGYAVNKATGARVEDKKKTADCGEILGKLAFDAGIAEDDEAEIEDLVGTSIIVAVRLDSKDEVEVHYTARIKEAVSDDFEG